MALQRPLADDALRIVARGVEKEEHPSSPAPLSRPQQPTLSTPVKSSALLSDQAASAPQPNKSKWFKAIKTKEEALETIKSSSSAFFFIAVLQAVLLTWLATQYPNEDYISDALLDPVIYGVCAAWLRWGRSRIAALILLITATVSLLTTIGAHMNITHSGKNIVLAGIVFWAAIKAVEVTFKLRGRFKKEPPAVEPQFG